MYSLILRSRYVARTPPVVPHAGRLVAFCSPGRGSNVENAPVDGQSPASRARTPRRTFVLCRHIARWTQACN